MRSADGRVTCRGKKQNEIFQRRFAEKYAINRALLIELYNIKIPCFFVLFFAYHTHCCNIRQVWRDEGEEARARAREEAARKKAAAAARRARGDFEAGKLQQRVDKGGVAKTSHAGVVQVNEASRFSERGDYVLLLVSRFSVSRLPGGADR